MIRPHYSVTQFSDADIVSYDEAAEHLRVDSLADQDYIAGLISVAIEYCISITGRAIGLTNFIVAAPSWESLQNPRCLDVLPLWRSPLVEVQSVKYYAPDASSLTTIDPADYRVITLTTPGVIQFTESFPSIEDRPDAIQIAFSAGSDNAADTPATLRHAVKLLVAHLYENRSPVNIGNIVNTIPYTLQTLIEKNRISGWSA